MFFLEHLNLLAIKAGRLLRGMVGKLTTHKKKNWILSTFPCQQNRYIIYEPHKIAA